MSDFLLALALLASLGWGYRLTARLYRFLREVSFTEDDE